jgi:NAD-dependent SIR2 family protein deacetylase
MLGEQVLEKVQAIFRSARSLVITAGAGMGVDSGLPDFRGDHGFWQAYPPYRRLGISFVQAANPTHFSRDPSFGWGFYGHRANLYRTTIPHTGFALLRRWIDRYGFDYFVVTSNVDGQFQKAGFAPERIVEVHGSIHHLQCCSPCTSAIWDNEESVTVDEDTMRSRQIPKCPRCGEVARPNILMFGDFSWLSDRTAAQERRFDAFCGEHLGEPMVVVELGAGTAIPTIRFQSESLVRGKGSLLIRINPREAQVPPGQVGLSVGALAGLQQLDGLLA